MSMLLLHSHLVSSRSDGQFAVVWTVILLYSVEPTMHHDARIDQRIS